MASLTGDYADGKMLLSCQPWDASMGTTNNVNTWRFIATPKDDSVFRANASAWTSYSSITVMAAPSNLPPLGEAMADVNKDGVVDVADIAAIISEMAAKARRNTIE